MHGLSLSLGAWIITGGSHTGVMKQVGEAVRDFSLSSSCKEGEVITIGVATWGTIHNREMLIQPNVSQPEAEQYREHAGCRGRSAGRRENLGHSEQSGQLTRTDSIQERFPP